MTGPSVFDWRTAAPTVMTPMRPDYPQAAYYWRKKAGLTGTRQNPDRHWRKKQNPEAARTATGSLTTTER